MHEYIIFHAVNHYVFCLMKYKIFDRYFRHLGLKDVTIDKVERREAEGEDNTLVIQLGSPEMVDKILKLQSEMVKGVFPPIATPSLFSTAVRLRQQCLTNHFP